MLLVVFDYFTIIYQSFCLFFFSRLPIDARNRSKRKSTYVRITNRRSYADKSMDEQIRDVFDMKCKNCEIELDTLRTAKTHYRTEHQQKGYLMCCERKFYRRFQVVDHVMMHINPNHVYKYVFRIEIVLPVLNNSFVFRKV